MTEGRRHVLRDEFHFSGDEEMNTTIGATLITNQSTSYPGHIIADGWRGVIRLTSNDHGFKASAKVPGTGWEKGNLIYIRGASVASKLNGIRKIVAVATNTLDIINEFVAATTPAGTETLQPALSYEENWEFIGYDLHLNAASATTENFVISVDSTKGAAWDRNILTEDMNGVVDLIQIYDKPIPMSKDDIVYCTWANTDNRLWGLTLYGRRMS
jgi:hypothetical protein